MTGTMPFQPEGAGMMAIFVSYPLWERAGATVSLIML